MSDFDFYQRKGYDGLIIKFEEVNRLNKKSLRQHIFEKRQQLSTDYYLKANAEIVARLFNTEVFQKANNIFIYHGVNRELDTSQIISEAFKQGKQVALPRVHGKGDMRAHYYRHGNQLTVSSFGIPEPLPESPEMVPKDIDLIIMPCVTCNEFGHRLGYGGGFYDRFLTKTHATTILPYFEKLLFSDIPMRDHDQLMDIILTEHSVYQINPT